MTSVDPIVTSFLVGYGAAAGHAEDEIDGLGLVGMVQPSAEFSSDAYDIDTLIKYFILHDPRTFRNYSNLGYCLHV
ncbi:hypothetical protein CU097_012968 [Rhizopus azygosporus]|uniref:Uncharacterized protein n=1 Tax=Rhizopus azygosporus TaxID=86630 RepID=A0A367KB13_RHIAZ|nr:hypothetical protein CU097_012968 [Rhizopus azygosporus]